MLVESVDYSLIIMDAMETRNVFLLAHQLANHHFQSISGAKVTALRKQFALELK